MAVVLETECLDEAERPHAVRQAFAASTPTHSISFLDPPEQIRVRLETWQLAPDIRVLRHSSSGISHFRGEEHGNRELIEAVSVVVHHSPRGMYQSSDVTHRMRTGHLYATDMAAHYAYRRPGAGTADILLFGRDILDMSFEQVQKAAPRLHSSPLYSLTRQHVANLCGSAEAVAASTRSESVGLATIQLIRDMFVTTSDDQSSGSREALGRYLIERVDQFIGAHYGDPELSVRQIAISHGVSERYLFQTYARASRSVFGTLMRTRISEAQHRLIAYPTATVEAIAHSCGFRNASHFSKRFRRELGSSPTAWREAQFAADDILH